MSLMLWAMTLPLLAAPPGDCRAAQDAVETTVAASLRETSTAWTAAFARRGLSYREPRLIFLCRPVGHPSRGSGYDGRIGLVLDPDDLDGVRRALGRKAPLAVDLIVAHEVGHHVQRLLGPADALPPGRERELQADCYAGWALAQGPRGRLGPDAFRSSLQDSLDRALQVLEALQSGGVTLRRDAAPVASHAALGDRVAEISRGFSAPDPWRC